MKILVTGFTALQVDTPHRTIQKIDVPAAMVKGLRQLGHNVDWRKADISENLYNKYDAAIVLLAPCNSLNARRGALGAMHTLAHIQLPQAMYYEDWQINQVFNSARNIARRHEVQFTKKLGDQWFYNQEIPTNHWPTLVKGLETIYDPASVHLYPRVGVVPMYPWGDLSKINSRMPYDVTQDNTLMVDPTPAVIDLSPQDGEVSLQAQKTKAWACASLMDHTNWVDKLNPSWPVNYFGSRKYKERGGERLKTEAGVRFEYSKHAGLLSPKYPHAGSGWFRSRFVYGALMKTIVYCDKNDAPHQDYWKPLHEIESLTYPENQEFAELQSSIVLSRIHTYDYFLDQLRNITNKLEAMT